MIYDCMIIGGGLAGFTCGIKCAEAGLRTVIISGGMNSLHFSSGSIDLFGFNKGKVIYEPFKFLKSLTERNSPHPYAKVGLKNIKDSLVFLKRELGKTGMDLYDNGELNHFHVTALGVLKPTYLSQTSVFNDRLREAFENRSSLCVLNFDGFRDYFSELTVEVMKKNKIFRDIEITVGQIRLPYYHSSDMNMHEFRSIDIARVFDSDKYLPRIADEIIKASGSAGIVSLPAFISINNYKHIHKKLEELTGKLIYEIPTLPPSILGLRLDNALRSRFASLGGEYSLGDKVVGGEISNGRLNHIITKNYGQAWLTAKYYLISTGSFLSGGLKSSFNKMEEPVLGLKFVGEEKRNRWYSEDFFAPEGHPFFKYGIDTNSNLNPYDSSGKTVKNLFAAGSILSGYDPVIEGSGGGTAIATGYYSALKIISKCKSKNDKS